MAGSLGEAQLQLSVDNKAFEAGLNTAKRQVESFSSTGVAGFQRLGSAVSGFAGTVAALAGVVGIGALAQQISSVGQASERSKIQLSALAGAYGEAEAAMASAARIAKILGISNLEARNSFSQLYGSLRGTGIGLKELEVLYVGLNKAARLSGAGSAEAASGILQLKQAFASGRAQGDELRSVLENLPVFAQAVAKEMKANVGELRQLGADGKITSDIIFKAAKSLASGVAPGKTQLESLAATFENVK
ncbi:MAG: tape measure protein, partial [Vulcanococcus sp.]